MARVVTVGGAQLGPIQRSESRASVVQRLLKLMRQAHGRGCDLVVFPELALTTFFPRWSLDEDERDSFFERRMPSEETRPLFQAAAECGIGFYLGYAELVEEGGRLRRFNSAILVDQQGHLVGKYRKVHLPGTAAVDPTLRCQHLEKRYFEIGNLGFPVWRTVGGVVGMLICNDRRWPEAYRVLGLQGVELILIGYNTPAKNIFGDEAAHLGMFHNHLSMQAGAYQNSAWVVGVAKAGVEEGQGLLAGSAIIAPSGEIAAVAVTEHDELIVAECDLDACAFNKEHIFNFAKHRRPEHYKLLTERTGAVPPP